MPKQKSKALAEFTALLRSEDERASNGHNPGKGQQRQANREPDAHGQACYAASLQFGR